MFLFHFNPADVSPELLVNRESVSSWLVDGYELYLKGCRNQSLATSAGHTMCLTGEKGMGKTILANRVVRELRRTWSGDTLFLPIDCRKHRSLREVVGEIALRAQEELSELQKAGAKIPKGLVETAGILVEVTRSDRSELKVIQEKLSRFRAALQLGGKKELLSLLQVNFGISLEHELKDMSSLTGVVDFDIPRLIRMIHAFFSDIRETGLLVFLLLDNVDELRHDYRDDEARRTVRDEAEWVLSLHEAPIAMLVCMRSYFAGVLPRALAHRRTLRTLPLQELLTIFQTRLQKERGEIQEAFQADTIKKQVESLAKISPTPLAFLQWVQWACENDLLEQELRTTAREWMQESYTFVSTAVLDPVIDLFRTARVRGFQTLGREELLKALNSNELHLLQLQDAQVVLPRDFWSPLEFTLDPTLHWLLA
jgi:hypothetical protein